MDRRKLSLISTDLRFNHRDTVSGDYERHILKPTIVSLKLTPIGEGIKNNAKSRQPLSSSRRLTTAKEITAVATTHGKILIGPSGELPRRLPRIAIENKKPGYLIIVYFFYTLLFIKPSKI